VPKDSAVVVARPSPLGFTRSFVDEARARLHDASVLVIVGPVGSGRAGLADEIARLADAPSSTRHAARVGDAALSRLAISQLFGSALLATADLDEITRSVTAQLQDLPATPHVVLTDAALCDPESVEVLLRLADSGRIRLVATVTPAYLAGHERLAAAGAVVTVPPLDADALADLLHERLGAVPHPLVSELLLKRCSGSATVARELADAAIRSGVVVTADDVLVLAPDDPQAAAGLLGPLLAGSPGAGDDTSVHDLLHLTALLGELDADEARACCGEQAVDAAVAHGTLRIDGDVLVFTAAAEGTLLARTLSAERCIELFDRFVHSVPRTLGRPGVAVPAAGWWRATGRLLPTDLAARAARHANLLGDYRGALVYSDPAVNDQHTIVAPMERGFAFNELGDAHGLGELFASLDPADLSDDELLPYLRIAAVRPDGAQRARLVQRAVAVDDPERRRSREAVRTLADLTSRSSATGDEKLVQRVRSVAFSAHLSPGNRAVAFASLSAVLRQSGRPDLAVESSRFALDTLTEQHDEVSAYHLDLAREVHILSLMSALDLDGADLALREYSSGVFARAGSGRLTSALQTYVSMGRGDLDGALTSSALFLAGVGNHDPHQVRGWVEAMTAECLVHIDRHDEAAAVLAESNRHPSRVPYIELTRRTITASTHDALAEPELALEILSSVIDEARERQLLLTHVEAAGTAVLIGGPPQVGVLVDAVDQLVDPSGTPLIWQTFAQAVRSYDIAGVVALADDLSADGAHWSAARVAQSVLDMARRATDLTPATRDRMGRLADLSDVGA
jgi:hypothetical protein